jgi:carboxymethylenebutenolidase
MTLTHQSIPVEAGQLPLAIARAGGTGAAVVIVPPAFGIAPDLEQQMEEVARSASLVVALDPFFRDDAGLIPYGDMQAVMARMKTHDRERTYRDLRKAIDFARAESGKPVVVLGICFGGGLALTAAADGAADGVVTWHGSRLENFVARAAEMRCPMRLHFGSVDPVSPPEAVEKVREAFAGRDDVRISIHDGAAHGFSHRMSERSYDAAAEKAGMASLHELAREVGR